MYVITVIPIGRGMLKEELSYFSREAISTGTLVAVPARKKDIPALVIGSDSARERRQELREAAFALRKVSEFKTQDFLPARMIAMVQEISRHYASSVGAVLSALLPKAILESAEVTAPHPGQAAAGHFETLALQGDLSERTAYYKQLIREEFARKRSVLLVTPTVQAATELHRALRTGIEAHVRFVHGGLSPKKIRALWDEIAAAVHPLVLIGTGTILSFPRGDIGAIIVDTENRTGFKSARRPFVDMRVVAERLAASLGVRHIIGSELLRLETLWRLKEGLVHEATPFRYRLLSAPEQHIIDMREYKPERTKDLPVLSDELAATIEKGRDTGDRLFFFVARRGFASQTICGDCGAVLLCAQCSAPVVLHGFAGAREEIRDQNTFFLCHHCGRRTDAATRCPACGSWKLRPLGIGLERVQNELTRRFPERPVMALDHGKATAAQGKKILADFETTPGAILVGTEFALGNLRAPFESGAIISLDSLFSLPDFRINERVFSIILSMRNLAKKSFLIQTRRPALPVLKNALAGNIEAFYRDEIAARKKFNYPPFTTLIKITVTAPPAIIGTKVTMLENIFADYAPDIFDGFIETVRGKSVVNALLTLPRHSWVDERLLTLLKNLPPDCQVTVDPENLL